MPHFITEYSANLKDDFHPQDLFAVVCDCLDKSGVFPLGGVRCRAIRLDDYRVADGLHDYAFIHMTLKVGTGRDLDTRKQVGDVLFADIIDFLAPIQAQRLLAISFTMEELDPILNYKKNNIHAFLQKKESPDAQ